MSIKRPFSSSFTLFELVLVVLLIAIFYFVFVQRLDFFVQKKEEIKLERLREYLLEQEFDKKIELLCTRKEGYINKCDECYLYVDGKKSDIKVALFNKEPIVYKFVPKNRELVKIEYKPIRISAYEEIPVCFRYECKKHRGCSSLILEANDEFYLFYPYFKETMIFPTFELLKDQILKDKESLKKDAF